MTHTNAMQRHWILMQRHWIVICVIRMTASFMEILLLLILYKYTNLGLGITTGASVLIFTRLEGCEPDSEAGGETQRERHTLVDINIFQRPWCCHGKWKRIQSSRVTRTLSGALYFIFMNRKSFRLCGLGICFVHLHSKNLLTPLKQLLWRWCNINRKLLFLPLLRQILFGL